MSYGELHERRAPLSIEPFGTQSTGCPRLFSGAGIGAVGLLLVLAFWSCRQGASSPAHPRPIPAREPAEFLALANAQAGEVVRQFDLGRAADAAQWRVTANAGSPRIDRDGVTFLAPRPGGRIEAAFELAAEDLDALETEVVGLTGAGFVEVVWESAVGDSRARGSQVLTARDLGSAGGAAARFLLRSDPSWRGRIRSLALRIANPAADSTRVRSISMLRLAGDETEVASELGRPFRVEVDHEVRTSFLLSRRGELELLDDATGPGWLRLGVALAAPASGRIVVGLRRREADGSSPGETVLDTFAAPAEPGRWEDRVVRVPASRVAAALFLRPELESSSLVPAVVGGIRLDPDPPALRAGAPDVLVISIDTLRADRLSLYGNARLTSPDIDAWAGQATAVLEDAVAPAPSTLPSHASLLTGREVLRHGAYLDVPLGRGQATLAEVFRQGGYETVAVTGGGYLHPFYGLHRGFDRYRFWPRRPDRNDPDLRDGVRRTIELLEESNRGPRLIFLHTYDVHAPYRAHEPYLSGWRGETASVTAQPLEVRPEGHAVATRIRRWPTLQGEGGSSRPMRPDEADLVSDLYDSGVAEMDAALAPLLRRVASPELRPRTIVVLLSDHGESLGEQSRWEHGYLDQTNLRVPLVLQLPRGDRGGRRIAGPASLVDVLPTLAEACGLDVPGGTDGRSLLARLGGGEAAPLADVVSYSGEINEGLAVRRGGLKWVLSDSLLEADGRARLFDLARDRAEISPEAPARVAGGPELERAGLRRLSETGTGTFLALENNEQREVRVAIEGPAVRWNSVKFALGDRPVATLRANGRISFELAPGAKTRLRLQDRSAASPIALRLRRSDGTEEEIRVAAAGETAAAAAARSGAEGVERVLSRAARVAVSVRVWDAYGSAGPAAGATALPADAERQLKALGYLD